MKVASIIGARPQFIKAAPVSAALRARHEEILIHTGQHYDDEMSEAFFRSLHIPEPNYNLGVGSGSHGEQTGRMLVEIERVLHKEEPDVVLVYGDTNSTLAAALAAAKIHLPVAHVGDVMYDVALATAQEARQRDALKRFGLVRKEYLLCTVHRPSNTDDPRNLQNIMGALGASGRPVLFPVHPRTRKALEENGLLAAIAKNVVLTEPLDYLDFQGVLMEAAKVVTDSGGVQKEAYFFGVPCVTLRDETEWIETVEDGWNVLVGADREDIERAIEHFNPKGTKNKSFGDGHAAARLVEILGAMR